MHCNHNYKHLKIRRGNAQRFKATNPVLQSGEIAYGNIPGLKFNIVKIGDGVTPWNDLPCLPFSDPVPYTTPPPVCVDDNFLSLQGGYFDLSSRGTPVGNNGSLENPNYTIPPSSYQFDYEGLPQDSPFVLANYGSKINPLGEDDFSASFSFYLTTKSGRNSQYGETFPLFTIGDNFNTNSLGEGELSLNLLKTSDNESSINVTSFSFQSDSLKESGISTEILPSSWYNFTLERANNLFTIKIEDDTLVSHSHAMSGIELGKSLSTNSFLIGNAYPEGSFDPETNPQFSGILIDNFQVTKTCPREYYCVQELPPTTPPPICDTFVSMGSTLIGVSETVPGWDASVQGVVQTPDTCGTVTTVCNAPNAASTWKFTSPTTMTFNGDTTNDVGTKILLSMDSMFITAGSSFHIFDHNSVEIMRYAGPLLLISEQYKNGLTDNNGQFYAMYSGIDVKANLATMSSSLGGNWGDYINNDNVFTEIDNPPAGSFNNAVLADGSKPTIEQFNSVASANEIHTFEIRGPNCTTTTTTTPSPEGCGFVSMGSTFMGVSETLPGLDASVQGVVQTPDTCAVWGGCSIFGCNCNQPHSESTWKFTSPTTMTFNGVTGYASISPLQANDLGSIILASMDSMFIAAGSSFHMFDHNNVEIIRYVGPLLLIRNQYRNGYTDSNGNFYNMYNGLDVQAALATMPSSLGGNWGDHITNQRVFDEMQTPPAGSFNNATILSNGQKPRILEWDHIAIGRGVHRFEIRTASTSPCPTTTTTTASPPL